MKVQELFEESMKAYTKRLVKDLNIERLGKGKFGQVFQHPTHSDVVVKVVSGNDKIYQKYLEFCKAHQQNKYIPKIIDVVKSGERSKFIIVFMEKLTQATPEQYVQWLMKNLGPEAEDAVEEWGTLFGFLDDNIEASDDADLKEVWSFIGPLGIRHFDLHAANVMFRGKQLVFTDPVSER